MGRMYAVQSSAAVQCSTGNPVPKYIRCTYDLASHCSEEVPTRYDTIFLPIFSHHVVQNSCLLLAFLVFLLFFFIFLIFMVWLVLMCSRTRYEREPYHIVSLAFPWSVAFVFRGFCFLSTSQSVTTSFASL